MTGSCRGDVVEGDQFVLTVVNRLSQMTVSIHWHGMRQQGTPWMEERRTLAAVFGLGADE